MSYYYEDTSHYCYTDDGTPHNPTYYSDMSSDSSYYNNTPSDLPFEPIYHNDTPTGDLVYYDNTPGHSKPTTHFDNTTTWSPPPPSTSYKIACELEAYAEAAQHIEEILAQRKTEVKDDDRKDCEDDDNNPQPQPTSPPHHATDDNIVIIPSLDIRTPTLFPHHPTYGTNPPILNPLSSLPLSNIVNHATTLVNPSVVAAHQNPKLTTSGPQSELTHLRTFDPLNLSLHHQIYCPNNPNLTSSHSTTTALRTSALPNLSLQNQIY
jgi:hypothetical protein